MRSRRALLEIVRAVSVSVEPAAIAASALERLASWLPAPLWVLLSHDPVAWRTAPLAWRGAKPTDESGFRALADWVVAHGVFASADLATDSRLTTGLVGSVLALPLVCRDVPVGTVIACDVQPSAHAPQLGVAGLASVGVLLEPVAAALDKALLLERAEGLSVTDDLTHLYNSRYLNQVLRRETKRAGRNGRPLSLLFVDLDGFKSINDTYGHLAGSRALVEAGAIIRGSARETDVAARFGGDEFALILPDTGGPGAMAVAERVRERIAGHTFLTNEGLAVRLTASVGVATLPETAATAEELVQAADAAMYYVKDRGKDGIHAALVAGGARHAAGNERVESQ